MDTAAPEQAVAALPFHAEATARIAARATEVFALVDEHARLSSHMSKPSWWLGGGSMRLELDEGRGQRVGSHIRLLGTAFGLEVSVDETVVERQAPCRKVWQTVGAPKLVIIGAYRMGFEISESQGISTLRVFIDYDLPPRKLPFAKRLADAYARWCTRRMAQDAGARWKQRVT